MMRSKSNFGLKATIITCETTNVFFFCCGSAKLKVGAVVSKSKYMMNGTLRLALKLS